MKGQDQWE